MKNQIQQHVMPLHDEPSQSTCPEPVVQTQILAASITQKSPVKDFEVFSYDFNDHKLV